MYVRFSVACNVFTNNSERSKQTSFGCKALYLSKKVPQTKLERLSIPNLDLCEKYAKVVVKEVKFWNIHVTICNIHCNCNKTRKKKPFKTLSKGWSLKGPAVSLRRVSSENIFQETIIGKIFETNFIFYVKQCTAGKVQFLCFSNFFGVLTKFTFREGNWALAYNFMTSWDFPNISKSPKIFSITSFSNLWGNSNILVYY